MKLSKELIAKRNRLSKLLGQTDRQTASFSRSLSKYFSDQIVAAQQQTLSESGIDGAQKTKFKDLEPLILSVFLQKLGVITKQKFDYITSRKKSL